MQPYLLRRAKKSAQASDITGTLQRMGGVSSKAYIQAEPYLTPDPQVTSPVKMRDFRFDGKAIVIKLIIASWRSTYATGAQVGRRG